MKYWMLLIFILLFAFNLQADSATLLFDYQGVTCRMCTSFSTTLGFVNSSTSTDVLDIQVVDKRYFSVIAFFFMLIIGVLYLQHKENRLSEPRDLANNNLRI